MRMSGKVERKTGNDDSVEIGAASVIAGALTMPMLAVLLAEAEALAQLIPGSPLPGRVELAPDADPFDNMPV